MFYAPRLRPPFYDSAYASHHHHHHREHNGQTSDNCQKCCVTTVTWGQISTHMVMHLWVARTIKSTLLVSFGIMGNSKYTGWGEGGGGVSFAGGGEGGGGCLFCRGGGRGRVVFTFHNIMQTMYKFSFLFPSWAIHSIIS